MKKSLVACVLMAAVVSSTQASASLNSFLVINGPKGRITGSVVQKGREGWIEVMGAEHRVSSPSPGGRTHTTFVVTKEIDASTPKLYQAMIAGDSLDITLNFFQPSRTGAAGGGVETLYYTVKLTKARVVDIKFKQPNTKDPETVRLPDFEEVAFNYADITWTYNGSSGSSATDSKKN